MKTSLPAIKGRILKKSWGDGILENLFLNLDVILMTNLIFVNKLGRTYGF